MISFPCTSCNEMIEVKHLYPGEQAICKSCGTKNIVPLPEDYLEENFNKKNAPSSSNLSMMNTWQKVGISENTIDGKSSDIDDRFTSILFYFSIGIFFHIIEFKIFNEFTSFNLSIIGAIFSLRAAYLLYKLGNYKILLITFMIICSLDSLSYLSELFFSGYFYFNFRILEVLILLLLYLKFTNEFEVFKEYKRYLSFLMTFFVLDAFLFMVAIISTPLLITINKLFSDYDMYLWLFGLFGVVLPIILIHFLVLTIFTYISFSMYKSFKKNTLTSR